MADEMHLEEFTKQRIAKTEQDFASFPLDAKPIRREDGKLRYEITFHLDHQDLVHLARVVHEYASDFPEFMRRLASKRLLVANRRDVLRSFGYDLFDDEGDDAPPCGEDGEPPR